MERFSCRPVEDERNIFDAMRVGVVIKGCNFWMTFRVVIHRRGFIQGPTSSLSFFISQLFFGVLGMYCGAAEFFCSPSAVRHIPVLLDECLSVLNPGRGVFLLT